MIDSCHPRESGDPCTVNDSIDSRFRENNLQQDKKKESSTNRKAQALKANLAKRKQQQKARSSDQG